MDMNQLRAMLAEKTLAAGSAAVWAKSYNIAPSYVNDVMAGRRPPGPAILKALGYERVITYKKID